MIWIVMAAAGLLTFASRFVMIGLIGERPVPGWLQRLLGFVGPSVLAVIIVPSVMLAEGGIVLADNPKIPAFLAAAVIAALTRNVIATIATGMILLWVIENPNVLLSVM